jgi:hypothetical protein
MVRPERFEIGAEVLMTIYTLVITDASGRSNRTLSEFPNDETAIGDVGQFVSAEYPNVAIAGGPEDDAPFLGAWDWREGRAVWTAGD